MADGNSNTEQAVFPVPAEIADAAKVDNAKYLEMYQKSVDDPDAFWGEAGKRLDWSKPYSKVKDVSYDQSDLHIRWYEDGELNVSYNLSLIHI